MGKRKRPSDHNQIDSSSDAVPCSSGMELLSDEKRFLATDPSELNAQQMSSAVNHQQSLSRSIFLKKSRQQFSHQYSRRGSASNLLNPSVGQSRGKAVVRDDKIPFRLASQCSSELGEYRERAFFQSERISPSFRETDAIPNESVVKMVCGTCRKLLIRRFYVPDSGRTTLDLSEVAVMACGHIFHAECLDEQTSFEDKRDPPCPTCSASRSEIEDGLQESLDGK